MEYFFGYGQNPQTGEPMNGYNHSWPENNGGSNSRESSVCSNGYLYWLNDGPSQPTTGDSSGRNPGKQPMTEYSYGGNPQQQTMTGYNYGWNTQNQPMTGDSSTARRSSSRAPRQHQQQQQQQQRVRSEDQREPRFLHSYSFHPGPDGQPVRQVTRQYLPNSDFINTTNYGNRNN